MPVKSKWKGNAFEWETAKAFSLWFTGGQDKTQLIRSIQSGGHVQLREASEKQVGDLSPNGPAGDEFRKHFAIECKHQKDEPDWWHVMSYDKWFVEDYWKKINEECAPLQLQPLLVMLMNRRPKVIMIQRELASLSGVRVELIIPRLDAAVILQDTFFKLSPTFWYSTVGLLRTT